MESKSPLKARKPSEPVPGTKGPEGERPSQKQLKCKDPECDGEIIPAPANGDGDNICKKCGKKFKTSKKVTKDILTGDINESIVIFKSPEILLTLNQNLRRKSKFEQKLNEAIYGRHAPSTNRNFVNIHCPHCESSTKHIIKSNENGQLEYICQGPPDEGKCRRTKDAGLLLPKFRVSQGQRVPGYSTQRVTQRVGEPI
jgi:hypothetical protein